MFTIIYTWKGERHRGALDYKTKRAAYKDLAVYRANGFIAWIEEIRR